MMVRHVIGREDGSALVELALTLPLLVLILAGAVDFARVFYTSIALTSAARAGAQYGSNTLAQTGDLTGMQTTAVNSVNTPGIAAVATRSCQCATNAGAFSATSPSANNCTAPAATSCPTGHVVITVTVTTSKTFAPLMGNVPGVPSSVNLSRTATLRAVN